MTPAELSAALRAVLLAAQADGALPLTARPGARHRDRRAPAPARARGLGVERRAPARQEGRHRAARRSPSCSRPGSRRSPGVGRVDVAGPGFLNITLEAAAAGELARTIVEAGAGVRAQRRARRAADQPRVRLRQPDRAAAHRRRPVGRGGRCARPGAAGQRRGGRPVSTTSTTTAHRSTVSPGRCSPAARGEQAPEDGYGGAVHRGDRRARAGRRRGRGGARPADAAGGPGAGGVPVARRGR